MKSTQVECPSLSATVGVKTFITHARTHACMQAGSQARTRARTHVLHPSGQNIADAPKSRILTALVAIQWPSIQFILMALTNYTHRTVNKRGKAGSCPPWSLGGGDIWFPSKSELTQRRKQNCVKNKHIHKH